MPDHDGPEERVPEGGEESDAGLDERELDEVPPEYEDVSCREWSTVNESRP